MRVRSNRQSETRRRSGAARRGSVLRREQPAPSEPEPAAEDDLFDERRLAAQDRVKYLMHAMGTSLEGSTADILAVVGELHAVPFELGIPRVYSVLKLDERRDREQTLEDKVGSVQRLLDEPGGA